MILSAPCDYSIVCMCVFFLFCLFRATQASDHGLGVLSKYQVALAGRVVIHLPCFSKVLKRPCRLGKDSHVAQACLRGELSTALGRTVVILLDYEGL